MGKGLRALLGLGAVVVDAGDFVGFGAFGLGVRLVFGLGAGFVDGLSGGAGTEVGAGAVSIISSSGLSANNF